MRAAECAVSRLGGRPGTRDVNSSARPSGTSTSSMAHSSSCGGMVRGGESAKGCLVEFEVDEEAAAVCDNAASAAEVEVTALAAAAA